MQPLAEAHDQPHVVVDDQQAEAAIAGQFGEDRQQLGGLHLVHPGGGLVEQQESRIGGQRPGDLDPALVAVAEAEGEVIGAPRQAEFGEQRQRLVAPRLAPRAMDQGGSHDVLKHRQVVEQPDDLE